MGDVYLAQDMRLGRQVALKMLPPYDQSDPAVVARFEREAKSAALLSHPNIVTVFELGQCDGRHYIAMEYVEGNTLAELITHGPLPEDQALGLALQVAEGLAAAHAADIVHRDIKPANILIDRTGRARICDFGLARLSSSATLTRTGSAMGTAAYMPPEQFQGGVVDHRADIWSLGAVAYEMITGRKPFEGDHESAILYAAAHEECPPPSKRRGGLSAKWDTVISRCLAKSPGTRFQSMTEVIAALREIKDERQIPSFDSAQAMQKSMPSLAVLPFVNMNADPENDFFADGLTEDLITAFSKMQNLRVVARTSAFQFKGKTSDVRLIGEQLNVGTVLEGSVRRAGNRLRVTAQLVNVADGFHIWSDRYDREMSDVFEIQDDIARAIVDALRVKLVAGAQGTIIQAVTGNIEAYQLVLQARFFWNKRTGEALAKAESLYKQAIARDPKFADAYAGLAVTYFTMLGYTSRPPDQLLRLTAEAVNRALDLNPNAVEAHCARGYLYMDAFEWEKSERSFRRSIELNPGHPTAHHWYALLLITLHRWKEAVTELELARSLDPLSPVIRANLATAYRFVGDLDRAKSELDAGLEIDPQSPPVLAHLSLYYEDLQNFNAAADAAIRAGLSNPQSSEHISAARYLILAGRFEDATVWLDRWIRQVKEVNPEKTFAAAFQEEGAGGIRRLLAEVCDTPWGHNHAVYDSIIELLVSVGEHDRALRWLDHACDVAPHSVVLAFSTRAMDPIRNDPRFTAILRKARLLPA